MKLLTKTLLVSTAMLTVAAPVFAAAPDGAGPWADQAITWSQGLRKDGSNVPATRSNPNSAVGPAENNTVEGNFFSLGFGGNIVLKFDNPISNGVVVVEATNPGYPTEKAKVELSADGVTWLNAGTVSEDGAVLMPERLSCAKYARLTDVSNKADFPNDADGYDVDGVSAQEGIPCETPDVPEFGTVTAAIASLMSGGAFIAIKRKFGMA